MKLRRLIVHTRSYNVTMGNEARKTHTRTCNVNNG
ncbi:hypothetical protein KSS87_007299 [Heliosperma pusillum]|nr:hypothetical protein KSS87_007299 [Heliosperma pusillum]